MAHASTSSSHRPRLAALGGLVALLIAGATWMASAAAAPDARPREAAAHDRAPGNDTAVAAETSAPALRTAVVAGSTGDDGAYNAPVGTRLWFEVQARVGSQLIRRNDGVGADRSEVEIDGQLQLTVLDRRDREAVVAICLPEARVRSASAPAEAAKAILAKLRSSFEQPVLARVDTSGRVAGYRFPVCFGYLEKAQLRAVLAGMRFIVSDGADAEREWTVLDRDDTGEFEAEYTWGQMEADARELARRRTRYTAPTILARGEGELKVSVTGRSSARVSAAIGWLVGAEFDDQTTVSFDALHADVRSWCTGSVSLSNHERVARDGLPAADWDGAWEPVGGDPTAAFALADNRELERWRTELEGVELGELVAQLAALTASGADDSEEYRDAWERLAHLFELRPELADEVGAWLAPGRVDEGTACGVLTALGCAGTPQAQAALLQIQRSSDMPDPLRGTATIALLQVQEPTQTALATMLESAQGEVVGPELGRLSLMVLGTVAPRAGAPLADGRRAVDALVSLEDRCRSVGTLDAWLHALGNSGETAVASHAGRYLDSEDERVREAAATALRSARSASAEQLLIAAATGDRSVAVRTRAAESLGEHGTGSAQATLCALLRDDGEVMVRESAMLGLAQNLDAAGRAALQRAAAQDPDAGLRSLAAQLLAEA